MQIEARRAGIRAFISGFLVLAAANLKHHAGALWGIGLKLDPDFPMEFRFFANHITDAVLEYRTYALLAPWCVLVAWGLAHLPPFAIVALGAAWTLKSWQRAGFYKTVAGFWAQAYQESPKKHRVRTHHAEELMKQIEKDMKSNRNDWEIQLRIMEAERVIEEICGKGE